MPVDKSELPDQPVLSKRRLTATDIINAGSGLLRDAKTDEEKEKARRIIHKGRVLRGESSPEEDEHFQVIPESIRRKLM